MELVCEKDGSGNPFLKCSPETSGRIFKKIATDSLTQRGSPKN